MYIEWRGINHSKIGKEGIKMNENKGVTKDVYVSRKLAAEIAELQVKNAELEFAVLVLQEENKTLKEKTDELGAG